MGHSLEIQTKRVELKSGGAPWADFLFMEMGVAGLGNSREVLVKSRRGLPIMLKVYTYHGCSTCRKSVKWLRDRGVEFEEIPIRETPPSPSELQSALIDGPRELRAFFNVSGQDYRTLRMKEKLPEMRTAEAIALLAGNGNLVKRPFALDPEAGVFLVGFKEEEWDAKLG